MKLLLLMLLFLKALFDVYISIVYWNKSIQTMGSLCLWQCLLVPTACTSTQGFRTQTLFAPNLFQFDLTCLDSVHFSLNQMTQNSDWSRRFLVQSRWLLASCVELIEERPQKSLRIAISFHFFISSLCQTFLSNSQEIFIGLAGRCVWFLPTSYIWLIKRSGAVAYIWFVRRLQD